MANTFGVRVYPHVWETGVALAAALQTDRDAARQPAEPQLDPPAPRVRPVRAIYRYGVTRGSASFLTWTREKSGTMKPSSSRFEWNRPKHRFHSVPPGWIE